MDIQAALSPQAERRNQTLTDISSVSTHLTDIGYALSADQIERSRL